MATLLDLTDRKDKRIKVLKKIDLIPIIANYAGYHAIKDLFCNELITIGEDQILMLPCSGKNTRFVIWFLIDRNPSSLNIEIFARQSEAVQADRIGRNSLGMFPHGSFVYLMSSAVNSKQNLTFARLDLSLIKSKYIGEEIVK